MAKSREIVPHTHTLGVDFVSPSVEVLGGHYHVLRDGGITSVEPDGPSHTHAYGDEVTNMLVALEDMDEEMLESIMYPGELEYDEDAARRKKKKKDKKKNKWSY